jgi:hypothetical protein
MDLDTLSLGPIAFGDQRVVPPPGLREFTDEVDLRPAEDLVVRIDAALDEETGVLAWRFSSVDPMTGEPPEDPSAGFLPPNVNPLEGEGSVLFTVMPKAGLPTGTEVRNRASIVFDVNPPIDTPEWLNAIDNSPPASRALALAETQASPSFLVQWAGSDEGSGIRDYTVLVSEDGGPFTTWLVNTRATSGTFTGQAGKTYGFYSLARDQTGNVEGAPAAADAATRVEACSGDCNGDGHVAINELITGVNIALGGASPASCGTFDTNGDQLVEIDELVAAVDNALNGCGVG